MTVGPTHPYTIYKNELKMIKGINARAKTTQFCEKTISEVFHDIGFGNEFLIWHQSTGNNKKKHL